MMEKSAHYIYNLIEQGEHQHLDFKFEISDSRKIARSLVAFSNSNGGTLLIGVKDNGTIAGIRSEEEKYMVEAAAGIYCKPKIVLKTKEWIIEGKSVLEVIIPYGKGEIYYANDPSGKWLAYQRVGDQNLLVNSTLLKVWKARRSRKAVKIRYSANEELLMLLLRNNKQTTLDYFRKTAGISRFKAEAILINFILLEIIDMVFTDDGVYYKLADHSSDQPTDHPFNHL